MLVNVVNVFVLVRCVLSFADFLYLVHVRVIQFL